MATLEEIRSSVKDALAQNANNVVGDDNIADRINRALNNNQLRVARLRSWDELEESHSSNFISGQDEYVLTELFPDTTNKRVKTWQSIVFEQTSLYRVPLTIIPRTEFDRSTHYEGTFSYPVEVSIYKDAGVDKLEFYPTPNGNYPVHARVVYWPDDFSDRDNNPNGIYLQDKDDVIIAFAKAQLIRDLGNQEDAIAEETLGRRLLEDAVDNLNQNQGRVFSTSHWNRAPAGMVRKRRYSGPYWNDPSVRRNP